MPRKKISTLSWLFRLYGQKMAVASGFLPILAAILFHPSAVSAAIPDDSYIAGYAAGALKRDFKLDLSSLIVRNGVITVPVGDLTPEDRTRILQILSEIPGVTGVIALESTSEQAIANPQIMQPADRRPENINQQVIAAPAAPGTRSAPESPPETVFATGFLPTGHLFKPLLADPRWAHFSAAYRNYIGDNIDGNNNGAVSFGETIPFYRANLGKSIVQWETGLQAGVFSDFNLDARSSDLINTDFIASVYASVRARQFSAFGRIFHQSSHLGDEFLLRTTLERINLSYEGADLKLSYELPYGVRVYGGGGGIFHKQPSTIKPWLIHYGVEFRSPWRIEFASMRPILAVDLKNWEQNNWNTDVSARAGVQFDNFQAFGRKLQFLMEYFHGNSPTGQFYKERVEYIGIGAHYHF
ncbi:DUF1207 domain-containing protein [Nitrosospira sp. NpAV]|uniref:DUF1207 domain-containing protein n=1 Tax=Nitrosospira sp. NpAV TaxID=58133 RepID=UPI0005A108C3|nr:DUF1207 domain-containing protein [Nitrosospira sp. NpAV]KIO50251.1 hypothetical protein SQ11_00635 [Nitrosospira sp. NpAV]